MINLAILGSTNGTSIQYTFDKIKSEDLDADIQVVISNISSSGILERAKANNFNHTCVPSKGQSKTEYDDLLLKELSKYKINLIVLVGYMRILGPEFVKRYKGKIINVHPSLLPKFAGGIDGDVHAQVITSKEKESGCTVHIVDEKVDSGKILIQKKCLVDKNETIQSLKLKVQKLEGKAIFEVIKNWKI